MKHPKTTNALSRLYFRKHIPFLLLIAIVTGCMVAVLFTVHTRVAEIQNEVTTAQNDVDTLKKKQLLVNSFIQEQPHLDTDLQLMNKLIPQSQDYFTIIQSLENLSQQSKFQITSYTINLSSSTDTKLAIVVKGVGDSDAFVRFLDTYQVNGGRLITIEKVTINPLSPGEVELNMNFYIEQSSKPSEVPDYQQTLSQLEKIKSAIHYDFSTPVSQEAPDLSFPSKSNPF